ncbi:MAG: ribonuclease HII [Candidatus Eisenbacteria bacterium]|nr:ribonuclease HII [Candidatus Eisenbacteria bacterium]
MKDRDADGREDAPKPAEPTGGRPLREFTVSRIRHMVAEAPPEPGDLLWNQLCRDRRSAVREIAARLKRRRAHEEAVRRREEGMRSYEAGLWERGLTLVAGADEVGRGPLAGPVVAAAVVLPRELTFNGIDDSKKLVPQRREELHGLIRETAVGVGIGSVSHEVIDEINILRATHRAIREAVENLARALGRGPEHVLVDGEQVPDLRVPQTPIHRGDELCTAIAAASIVAKVTRDRLLEEYDTLYPGYGFANHKGYGTPEHLAALTKLGPCDVHRKSFTPVFRNGDRSQAYLRFSARLLSARSAGEIEEIAGEIAGARDSLERYELAKLRDLYRRCHKRVRAGMKSRS